MCYYSVSCKLTTNAMKGGISMAVSAVDKKKLGKWIKQSREKKQPHLSQRQLALAVDITNASLSSIESGMIFPSEELLLKLLYQTYKKK